MKELKDSERSFLFLMTGNGALLYGICVSQNELLSVPPHPHPHRPGIIAARPKGGPFT